jgi:hypothetical protein
MESYAACVNVDSSNGANAFNENLGDGHSSHEETELDSEVLSRAPFRQSNH